jgi:nitrite reductase/ring-hydroxylating ferredoxin subunit
MIMGGISRFVEDLLRSRRPRRFRASEADAALARTAVTLRAARPGSGAPREEFVTGLHRQLAAELGPPVASRAVTRRRTVLRTAGVAAGAALAGAGIDHGLAAPAPAAAPAGGATLTPHPGGWLTVAASADLPDGAVRPFTAGAVTGFVERVGGRPRAVSGICTHQGCRLTLADHPARLVCPCHGATFGLGGEVLTHRLPVSLTSLPQLAVREIDGTVQVYAPLTEH